MRYVMEKVPGHDLWAVIDSGTHGPALVNDVPQIYLDLDDADDLTDLLAARSMRPKMNTRQHCVMGQCLT
jgi:hypothetical protein